MADIHSERARDNILPRSKGRLFPKVFEEWRVTGQVKDYGASAVTCELCEQEDLRYHFEIKNRFTFAVLWVGSSCILRFGVAVFHGSRRLSGKPAAKHLNKLIDDARHKAALGALRAVAKAEHHEILSSALDYFETHGSLTPKFAFVVFWRLQANGIEHNPAFFKINLRRDKYVRDLEAMEPSRRRRIWPALSSGQRRKLIESGVFALDEPS